MKPDLISYQLGIPESCRSTAVALFDLAFGEKIAVAIPSKEARQAVFLNGFNLDYAIVALYEGKLVGMAGFQGKDGALTSGVTYRSLIKHLGIWKGSKAALVLSLYERKSKPKELVMDGISVLPEARSMGIGQQLLKEIATYAANQGYDCVRLDVIDTNPRARSLYQRFGFKAVKIEQFPMFKRFLGFGGVTTMRLDV